MDMSDKSGKRRQEHLPPLQCPPGWVVRCKDNKDMFASVHWAECDAKMSCRFYYYCPATHSKQLPQITLSDKVVRAALAVSIFSYTTGNLSSLSLHGQS